MKYNEEEYKQELAKLYGTEIEVVGHFKGLSNPILLKDKYGILACSKASLALKYRPTIKAALNPTEYFMSQLREKYPKIAEQITPASEYKAMKKKMLFQTKFGLVSVVPDSLIHGDTPNVRSAVNRKEYMYNQLKYLYEDKYDFEILSTDRHKGKCILICPIHGKVEIDNDYIFSGCGCIECNTGWTKSNSLYVIKLIHEKESFYKLGITYRKKNGELRRYRDYRKLGYKIEIIKEIDLDNFQECVDKEYKLKQLIKNNLYQPKIWDNKTSTECFTKDLLDLVLENI